VLFVDLARQLANAGDDAGLVEWRNAAACARRAMRSDGYGIVRYKGRLHGFFLEFDRGTMRTPGYLKKLAAYDDYLVSGRFLQDYAGFPTILVIAPDNTTEERIAQAARAGQVGRTTVLPLRLTCLWRIRDERRLRGLLGPIWRDADAGISHRHAWLDDSRMADEGRPISPY
jgi:hypothetical protein